MTVEWLDGEDADELPQPPPVGPGRRQAIWIVAIALVVALAVGVVVSQTRGDGKPAAARTNSGTSASSSPGTSPSSSFTHLQDNLPDPVSTVPTSVPGSRPRVVEVGHRVLGATSNWELFAYGTGTLIRIEMAAGVIHRTPTPELLSNGGLNFVVGSTSAILRPFDAVDGYVIKDGQPARVLRGLLAQGGSIYPGPTADRIWVQAQTDSAATPPPRLYDLRLDKPVDTGPTAPPALGQPYMADGSGYLLYGGVGGVYDVRPDGVHRITTGTVAAAGDHVLLAQECDDTFRCSLVRIDTRSGARTTLGPTAADVGYLSGIVSPDGRYAAYSSLYGTGATTHIVNMSTGADKAIALQPSESAYGSTPFLWDPDNDNLLVVDQQQTIRVIDPATGKVSSLGVDLPPVDEIAFRPATG